MKNYSPFSPCFDHMALQYCALSNCINIYYCVATVHDAYQYLSRYHLKIVLLDSFMIIHIATALLKYTDLICLTKRHLVLCFPNVFKTRFSLRTFNNFTSGRASFVHHLAQHFHNASFTNHFSFLVRRFCPDKLSTSLFGQESNLRDHTSRHH